MNQEIAREHAGFRSGRGTRDQLFNLKTIIEKTKECNQTIYLCFIGYSKAFDSINYTQLRNIMHKLGFPHHLNRLIKQLYHNQESCIRVNNENTDKFRNGKGVRKGCILSPYLFNIYTEYIMRIAAEEQDGIKDSEFQTCATQMTQKTYRNCSLEWQESPKTMAYNLTLKRPKSAGKMKTNLNNKVNNKKVEQVENYTY